MPQFEHNYHVITIIQGTTAVKYTVRDYIQKYLSFSYHGYGEDVGIVIAELVLFQVFAFVATTFLDHSRR